MTSYLWLPLYALIVILIQISILDALVMDYIDIEISLVLVIFAASRLSFFYGGFLSILLGFFLDALVGASSGLYTLIYTIIFGVSYYAYKEIYLSRSSQLMLYVFAAAMIKGVLVILYYSLWADFVLWGDMLRKYLPQAILLGLLSPYLFRLFYRIGFLSAHEQQGYIKR